MGSRKLWVICVAIWFALWGLLAISTVKFEAQNLIMGIVAIAAAILIAFDK